MVHLVVHLPDEAMLRGPVQFGWMYPVERRLYTLKRLVWNKARTEGSIAEAYVANEALTFCSRCMDDVKTRFNRAPRNPGFSDPSAYAVDVFGHGVNLIGACDLGYSEDFDQMVWYVLYNCDQAHDYIKMFEGELQQAGVEAADLDRRTRLEFATWFRNHIWRLNNSESIGGDLFALACGPDPRVRSYPSCVVNGVRFCTAERDQNKKTQNSGVACAGVHNNQLIDYFRKLTEIIELQYNSHANGTTRNVILFRCEWYKLDGKKTALKDDGLFRSINTGTLWFKKDCFILATQAKKIFYLPDNKHGQNWQLVQTFKHRNLYNVAEQDACTAASYQQTECIEENVRRREINNNLPNLPLNRVDEDRQVVDGIEVSRLMRENPRFAEDGESSSDEVEDDMVMEYFNEDEAAPLEVDSDDE